MALIKIKKDNGKRIFYRDKHPCRSLRGRELARNQLRRRSCRYGLRSSIRSNRACLQLSKDDLIKIKIVDERCKLSKSRSAKIGVKTKESRESIEKLQKSLSDAIKRNPEWAIKYQREKLNLQLAGFIHEMRTQSGWTQKQLAEQIGVPQSFVARLERSDDSKKPTLDTIAKIAHAFNKQLKLVFVDI